MTARAIVTAQHDPFTVSIALGWEGSDGRMRHLRQWPPSERRYITPEESNSSAPSDNDWLRLEPDEARALYEALAEHYGHTANDMRALRKDYDAERARVDTLNTALLKVLDRMTFRRGGPTITNDPERP